jgi:hypothetical protein
MISWLREVVTTYITPRMAFPGLTGLRPVRCEQNGMARERQPRIMQKERTREILIPHWHASGDADAEHDKHVTPSSSSYTP